MTKGIVYLLVFVGGLIGSYIPVWLGLGDGLFSVWGIIGGLIGSFAGIWVAYKIGQNM